MSGDCTVIVNPDKTITVEFEIWPIHLYTVMAYAWMIHSAFGINMHDAMMLLRVGQNLRCSTSGEIVLKVV